MFEQEVTLLCGEAYRPLESVHRRAGSEPVTIFKRLRAWTRWPGLALAPGCAERVAGWLFGDP